MAGQRPGGTQDAPYDDLGRGSPLGWLGHLLGGTSVRYLTLLRHERLGRPAVITNGKEGAREVGRIAFRWQTEVVRAFRFSSA